MDKLKIKLTINAALKQLEMLEQSLEKGDQRAVGAALHNSRRELYTLKTLVGGDQQTLQDLDADQNEGRS
jgi:hypothetical protein